jgi:hypothetical protein
MALKQETAPLPLVIWGASEHARVVTDIIRLTGKFEVRRKCDREYTI